jgi:hypothetical protein
LRCFRRRGLLDEHRLRARGRGWCSRSRRRGYVHDARRRLALRAPADEQRQTAD